MVRDLGDRFTENVSFIIFVEVPRSLMGQTNHETPRTIQATMEPSSDLRGFLATFCLQNLQHLKHPMLFFRSQRAAKTFSVSVPINIISFPGTTETRLNAQAPCIKTGMKWAI